MGDTRLDERKFGMFKRASASRPAPNISTRQSRVSTTFYSCQSLAMDALSATIGPSSGECRFRCSTPPSCARMCRRPEQRGARRASARAVAWRLHHENPRKIGRLRGYHRLRPDRRRSLRRASLRNPARYRARHSAPRRHLRQRLRQQGQSGRRESAPHRSRHPPQGQRKEQASLLRTHPLQGPRPHRAGRRTAQALQARRAPMRKDRTKLQINRQLRRRPLLDQIRPHGLGTDRRDHRAHECVPFTPHQRMNCF
jgi:hypothetical protein